MAHQTLTPRVARATDHARETARDTVHEASPGLIWLGRCGLAAKGAVYVLIGVAATRAALGTGDQTIDSHGAFGRIVEMPFGTWLLGVVALGLVEYTIWRVLNSAIGCRRRP